jgi:hypothetical protein
LRLAEPDERIAETAKILEGTASMRDTSTDQAWHALKLAAKLGILLVTLVVVLAWLG